MLRRVLWLVVGAVAGFLLARRRSGREREPDPAQELRRKLDEARERETPPAPDGVEARRAEVHERGRSVLDDMRRSGSE